MAKPKTKVNEFRTMENWQTRYGHSIRVVTRDSTGKFVDQVSLTAIIK